MVEKNSIVTGGSIASMLLKEKVNDFDVYFTNKETTKAVAEYYVKEWNEANGDDGYVLDGAVENDRNPEMKGGVALNMTPDRIKIIFESKGVAKEDGAIDDENELEEWPDESGTLTSKVNKLKVTFQAGVFKKFEPITRHCQKRGLCGIFNFIPIINFSR